MGAASDVTSPLMRARYAVMIWVDLLPKDAQLEASMAMDCLIQLAEREIENAYRDGSASRSAAARAQKLKEQDLEARDKAQGE